MINSTSNQKSLRRDKEAIHYEDTALVKASWLLGVIFLTILSEEGRPTLNVDSSPDKRNWTETIAFAPSSNIT